MSQDRDHDWMRGTKWSPEDLMKICRVANGGTDDRIDALKFAFNKVSMAISVPKPLFVDKAGGFDMAPHVWNKALRTGDKEYVRPDALRHRDEALSRAVQCRLTGRVDEAKHWRACMRFFENKFGFPPVGEMDGDSQE